MTTHTIPLPFLGVDHKDLRAACRAWHEANLVKDVLPDVQAGEHWAFLVEVGDDFDVTIAPGYTGCHHFSGLGWAQLPDIPRLIGKIDNCLIVRRRA